MSHIKLKLIHKQFKFSSAAYFTDLFLIVDIGHKFTSETCFACQYCCNIRYLDLKERNFD